MNISICDDDKAICIELEQYIDDFCRKHDLDIELRIYNFAEDLLNDIRSGCVFDVIFLDIYMNGIDGIEAGRVLRNEINAIHTEIVFVTSSIAHYEDAMDIRSFHYLKKPVERAKFEEIFLKLIDFFAENPKLFTYQKHNIQYFVRLSDIVYFEVRNRQVTIISKDKVDKFYSSIKEVVDLVDSKNFLIPHRAYYVNSNYIVENRGDSLLLANGAIVPVSNKRKKEIEEELMMLSD